VATPHMMNRDEPEHLVGQDSERKCYPVERKQCRCADAISVFETINREL